MIKIHNTASKRLEVFEEIEKGKLSMYVCGPTVYDNAHLGHGRSATAFDVIRRYFIYKGFDVQFVSNYTDIDDKMITRAAEEGIGVEELANKVIPEYEKDYGELKILTPDIQPLATEHIPEMLDMIARLEKAGHTYVLEDGVYFDVRSFDAYGKLSGQDIDELQVGARIDVRDDKKNPQDFVLWKFKKKGEPFWPSAWGDGRPGWHIECSAMTWKHLGERFDIHGGGLDLTFPHHECEVAQTEGCFGEGSFAKYWLHNGFIQVDNEKMSKSLGNFFTLKDIFKKYDPLVVRFMFLQTHYRNPINFSDAILDQAKASLERVHDFVRNVQRVIESKGNDSEPVILDLGEDALSKFESSMDNDFDTSGALGAMFELIKGVNVLMTDEGIDVASLKGVLECLRKMDEVFAVIFVEEIALDSDVETLIAERNAARDSGNYDRADEIRDELLDQGIVLEDTATGTVWKRS